jgi:hypothetical protein
MANARTCEVEANNNNNNNNTAIITVLDNSNVANYRQVQNKEYKKWKSTRI